MGKSDDRDPTDRVEPDPSVKDRVAISRMHVSDAGGPRDVAHTLWVPDDTASRRVAEAIHKPGRTVVTGPDSPTSGCPVIVFAHHELTPEILRSLRAEFEAAAERFGGSYEGWSLPGDLRPEAEGDR